jgi:hypothetical protein
VHLCAPEFDEQLRAVGGVGIAEVECRQRLLEESRGLVPGERAQRRFARPRQVRHRLGRIAPDRGLEEVVRQLSQARLEVTLEDLLDRLAHRGVELSALDRPESGVERLAHQPMGEGERRARRGARDDQSCNEGPVESFEQLRVGDPRCPLEDRHGELAPDHRRCRQQLLRILRKGDDAARDRVAHSRRKRKTARRQPPLRVELSLGGERSHHLSGKEGVPGSEHAHGAYELLRRRGARHLLEHQRQVRLGQAGKVDLLARAHQTHKDGLRLGPQAAGREPVGRHAEHRRLAQLARDELERKHGIRAGGVDVVKR